jgi:hypothetical protein
MPELENLAKEINTIPNWWLFPTDGQVKGFFGSSSIFFVGDQPSHSNWGANHPSRIAFYNALKSAGACNAHLTDLYKKRGESSELREGLLRDFNRHIQFFRREIHLLKPVRIIAVGRLAYKLLWDRMPDLQTKLRCVWHFSYVARTNRIDEYKRQLKRAMS